jgi:hypothetical protein
MAQAPNPIMLTLKSLFPSRRISIISPPQATPIFS